MQDWLGRVRPGLAKLAFTAGRYGECVRQAGLVLASLARTGGGAAHLSQLLMMSFKSLENASGQGWPARWLSTLYVTR